MKTRGIEVKNQWSEDKTANQFNFGYSRKEPGPVII